MSASESPATRAMSRARAKLTAIAAEELHDVAAVAEEVHDVVERGGVREAERVTELVQAGQVDDGLAEQIVCGGALRDLRAESVHVGTDVDGRATAASHDERPHLAVLAVARVRPVQPHEGGRFRSRDQAQRGARVPLPGRQRPVRELAIAGTVPGAADAISDVVPERVARRRAAAAPGFERRVPVSWTRRPRRSPPQSPPISSLRIILPHDCGLD